MYRWGGGSTGLGIFLKMPFFVAPLITAHTPHLKNGHCHTESHFNGLWPPSTPIEYMSFGLIKMFSAHCSLFGLILMKHCSWWRSGIILIEKKNFWKTTPSCSSAGAALAMRRPLVPQFEQVPPRSGGTLPASTEGDAHLSFRFVGFSDLYITNLLRQGNMTLVRQNSKWQ